MNDAIQRESVDGMKLDETDDKRKEITGIPQEFLNALHNDIKVIAP
jgi:hypothetical protein